jgi:hypothetical protein
MATENDKKGLDDPLWPHVVRIRLEPYVPYVRKWWSEIEDLAPYDTGVFELSYDEDQPPGLFQRFTRTPIRSPIRGIQAFPFIVAGYLQISGVHGGSTKLIQKLCLNGGFKIDEFTVVELHNLPSTFNQGQLIAFVPTEIYEDSRLMGKWIYLTNDEISGLIKGEIYETVRHKAILKG